METSIEKRLREEGEALLSWLNQLPFFREDADFTAEDLSDGTKLWQALREFSPQHFPGDLPRNDGSIRRRTSHVQNLQNIKKVHKAVRQYVLQELQMALPNGFEDLDLNTVAEGANIADFTALLKAIFCIGVLRTSDNEAYVLAITLIPEAQQRLLMVVTQELQDAGSPKASEDGDDQDVDVPIDILDPDAQNDEHYIKLIATNNALEKQRTTLRKDLEDRDFRLSRLQENNMTLQRQLEEAQASLDRASQDVDQGYLLREFEAKHKSQDDYIASLEEQMQGLQEKETAVHAELNKLRKVNERVQPLQDEIDELRAARDNLSRRNNMLERYKHKVQSVQELENENRALRRELEESRYVSEEGDGAKQSTLSMQREVRELQTLMQNTEIQLVESTNRRKQLEYEVAELYQRLEEAAQQRERDQETLAGMREGSPRLDDEAAEGRVDLDQELETTESNKDKSQELQPRAGRVHKFTDEVARSMALQKLYQDEKIKSAGLQKRNMELSKRNILLEGILKSPEAPEQLAKRAIDFLYANRSHSTEAFTTMKSDLETTTDKAEGLEKNLSESQNKYADAEKTISMYEQEKVEAVETLKDLNSQEVREMQARLITLETRNSDLRIELDESRTILGQAFQQPASAAPEPIREPSTTDEDTEKQPLLDEQMRELMATVEQAKERESMQHQIQEKQDQTINELREEIRKATDKAAPSLLKASEQAALKKELENIRRENKLMATAYYDLANRLQMNTVSLQRRSEAPRGFLNRQRQLVNQATSIRTK